MRAKTLFDSFKFAYQGLSYSFKTQRNFRIHCGFTLLLLLLMPILKLKVYELLFLASAAFAVLVTELVNTAIEKTIDIYTTAYHPLAKIAKNCAAAAVLLAALYAVVVGITISVPRLLDIVGR